MAQTLNYGTYYSSPSGGGNKMRRLIIVGAIVAVVLGGTLFALSFFNGNSKSSLTLLAAKENSLLTLAGASTTTAGISNSDLATANSNAILLLTGDVAGILSSTGQKSLPGNVVAQEVDTNGTTLKNASLLNKFDSTYRQIVVQKVEPLIVEAQALRGSVGKSSQKVVDQAIVNLQSIDKQFSQLQLQ